MVRMKVLVTKMMCIFPCQDEHVLENHHELYTGGKNEKWSPGVSKSSSITSRHDNSSTKKCQPSVGLLSAVNIRTLRAAKTALRCWSALGLSYEVPPWQEVKVLATPNLSRRRCVKQSIMFSGALQMVISGDCCYYIT